MSDQPWSGEAENLVRGLSDETAQRITSLIENAGSRAKAGNLTAAAEALETVRRILVERNNFRRYDNDIWVFTAIISYIRRESPEVTVPKAYQLFIDAKPSLKLNEELTRTQRAFWYGSPDAQVGGEIRIVSQQGNDAAGQKKGCFIATAVYGSDMAPEVEVLRNFRDSRLLPHPLGLRFVEWYYKTSPRLANWIEPRPFVRKVVRMLFLSPLLLLIGGSRPDSCRTDNAK